MPLDFCKQLACRASVHGTTLMILQALTSITVTNSLSTRVQQRGSV